MAKVFSIDKGQSMTYQTTMDVVSGTAASIARGTPTKSDDLDTAVNGSCAIMVDGDGSTAQRFTGLAKSVSNETASAAGTVDIWVPVPGVLYRGFAKSSTAADTWSEVRALTGKRVVFDLTSSDWTVDTAAADALANCVVIVSGIPTNSEVLFFYAPKGTMLDSSTAIT